MSVPRERRPSWDEPARNPDDGPVLRLAVEGPLDSLAEGDRRRLMSRSGGVDEEVREGVREILDQVRDGGDATLREAARRWDGAEVDEVTIPRERWRQALESLEPSLVDALETAAGAIRRFHRAQSPRPLEIRPRPGIVLGRRPEPLRCVGVYAPGGRAAYPSSVLMTVIPARTAGVGEVVVCSPPQPDGLPHPGVLAACELAGADRLFAAGGAAAVAALAFGTESVPRVDKVVGPGNVWVTEAKRQLAGTIESDCLAGPSEVLVVADETADPEIVALEMMAQAEHDPGACAVLVTSSTGLADRSRQALSRLLPRQPRAHTVAAALASHGAILTAPDLDAALEFAAEYAPEHLLLLVREPRSMLHRVRAAGAVFLGPASSVVFGDYVSGTNHVLPTGGRARASSGLSTGDFVRWSSWQQIDPEAAADLAEATGILAEAEGLGGHALAARARRSPRPGATIAPSPTNGSASGQTPAGVDLPRRSSYLRLRRYDPGRSPVELDLSDNTNLFGRPPAADGALGSLTPADLGRYPQVYSGPLKECLAELHDIDPACIVTGCGSDDLIDSAIRAFCEPGDRVAFPDPTFSMLPAFAHMNGAEPVSVPLGADFALDAPGLAGSDARVIYVCRPNNPTGNAFDRDLVKSLATASGTVLLVDEAYADFADDDLLDWAPGSGRALVLRTLSKAWGLAGLRVGYAVGPSRIVEEVEKSRGPYKVGGVAEAVATAVVREDAGWVREIVERVRENRERLSAALADGGLRAWPSAANFLLMEAPGGDAAATVEALRRHGVGVRGFPGLSGVGDCIRVTVGPWPSMERFLEALGAVGEGPADDTVEDPGDTEGEETPNG